MKTLEEDVLALLDQIGLLEKAAEDTAHAVRSGLDLQPPLRLEHWTAIAVCAHADNLRKHHDDALTRARAVALWRGSA